MENKKIDEYLYNLLEKIVFKDFQEDESSQLKAAIRNLFNREIDIKTFKKILLESRVSVLEQLLSAFPFYHERQVQKDQLSKEIEVDKEIQILKRLLSEKENLLNDKDVFYEEIGERVNDILKTFSNNAKRGKLKT